MVTASSIMGFMSRVANKRMHDVQDHNFQYDLSPGQAGKLVMVSRLQQ